MEKERLKKTLHKVKKNEILEMKTKTYLKEQIPEIDISDIFVKKQVSKKEDEEELWYIVNNFNF